MLTALLLLVLLALLSVGLNIYLFTRTRRGERPAGPTFVSAPTLERLQELADLVVVRVQVADVLEGKHPDGAKIAILLHGDCDYAVDLSAARLFVDNSERVATIELPPPAVVRPRVNHDRTKIYDIRRTAWLPWIDPRDELLKTTMERAQAVVEHAARESRHAEFARLHTEAALRSFYIRLGWTVDVVWKGSEEAVQPPVPQDMTPALTG